ncbi:MULTISPECIES: hypothetical protein [unclassified Bradyrhizobium]|uniref:hypothetical protein n=1 Tax=unclassified Bradyrhizobium TaxID=2631580 RepID=UPI002915CDD9|nr:MULTISPECIES: hypothetical protein [unclassified Bradyrhizobium]
MGFTQQELASTAGELRRKIADFLSKETEPDVLLGSHPLVAFASQRQSIAIWHGHRIEDHLAEWISKAPNWAARSRERIIINGIEHEIDNVAFNQALGLVLSVEAKRVWANQDSDSKASVKRKHDLYMNPMVSPTITAQVGLPGSDFRHFVFDVYGNTKKGKNGMPIISGDKIGNIFDPIIATYVEWERTVIANAILARLDLHPQAEVFDRERLLAAEILAGARALEKSKQSVLDYIGAHAR